MANSKKGIITTIGICATIIGMFVGGSTIKGRLTAQAEKRAVQDHKVEDTAEAVEAVKVNGCDPSRRQQVQISVAGLEMSYVQSDVEELKDDVAVISKGVSELKDDFGKYQIEQKIQEQANTTAILKAIEDKP